MIATFTLSLAPATAPADAHTNALGVITVLLFLCRAYSGEGIAIRSVRVRPFSVIRHSV